MMPSLVAIGDCGACVLGGLLGLTPSEVYARYVGQPASLSYDLMRRGLESALRDGFLDRVVLLPATWSVDARDLTWGARSSAQWRPWFDYLRMALEAGYYGLAMVSFESSGGLGKGADHWVLLRGARERLEPIPQGGGVWMQEVLLSCPTRGEEWVSAQDCVTLRGGFNAFLARPAAQH